MIISQNADISTYDDALFIGPIMNDSICGYDYITFYRSIDGNIRVSYYYFNGNDTIDEFEKRVKNCYSGNENRLKLYLDIIKLAKNAIN